MKSVDICKSIISSIKKQFDDRTFRNTYRVKNAFSRNRELGFEQLCYYLLNSTTKTMPINISDMKEDFPTQSYSMSFPVFLSEPIISKICPFIRGMAITHMRLTGRCCKYHRQRRISLSLVVLSTSTRLALPWHLHPHVLMSSMILLWMQTSKLFALESENWPLYISSRWSVMVFKRRLCSYSIEDILHTIYIGRSRSWGNFF